MRTAWAPLLWMALLAGCATTPPSAPTAAPTAAPTQQGDQLQWRASAEKLGAALWMQSAAEYAAVTRGSFNMAMAQIERGLADPQWDALPREDRAGFPLEGLPPAVIVDADETMIDNSAFTARSIRAGVEYDPALWAEWVNQRAARAIPGALEFARFASERGVKVFYVTNRSFDGEYAGTRDNLRALGFPIDADESNLLLMGDPRAADHEKGSRRRWIAQRYRVLLMLGDNLGDFVDGYRSDRDTRQRLVEPYAGWWGQRWIMLPNPSYGSWESAVKAGCVDRKAANCLPSVLRYD